MTTNDQQPSDDRQPADDEQPADAGEEAVERLDPDAPGRSLFDDDEDAVEPNEPA